MDCKNIKNIFFSQWLFEIIHIIGFEMRIDSRIILKIFLGYDISYRSICSFMHHPWFPARKALKPLFVCDVIHQQAENSHMVITQQAENR